MSPDVKMAAERRQRAWIGGATKSALVLWTSMPGFDILSGHRFPVFLRANMTDQTMTAAVVASRWNEYRMPSSA